jgi:hypothetical protein
MFDEAVPADDIGLRIREPRLKRLYDYWCRLRRGRPFPERREIDPLDFSYLLGHVMLVDVLREPLRFRVRLHGTELAEQARYELTNKMLDELPISDWRDYVLERCRGLVESRQPTRIARARELGRKLLSYEAVWLPFSNDQKQVDMLMCGVIYDRESSLV